MHTHNLVPAHNIVQGHNLVAVQLSKFSTGQYCEKLFRDRNPGIANIPTQDILCRLEKQVLFSCNITLQGCGVLAILHAFYWVAFYLARVTGWGGWVFWGGLRETPETGNTP